MRRLVKAILVAPLLLVVCLLVPASALAIGPDLLPDEVNVMPGTRVPNTLSLKNTRQNSAKYMLRKAIVDDGGLCPAVWLGVRKDDQQVYRGKLEDFATSPDDSWVDSVLLPPGSEDAYRMVVGLRHDTDSFYSNKYCVLKLGRIITRADIEGGHVFADYPIYVKLTAGTWNLKGDIVINEVAWGGSILSAADEWIELRNTRDFPISLAAWGIGAAGSGSTSLPISGTIPANGLFLISNYATTHANAAISNLLTSDLVTTALSLADAGEHLVLTDQVGKLIDETPLPHPGWPAGVHDIVTPLYQSMERDLLPGDGSDPDNWHTCSGPVCDSTLYWDVQASSYGTPGYPNSLPD